MVALVGALIAGALTTLAPCVLPMLPIIVGSSMVSPDSSADSATSQKSRGLSPGVQRALIITAALGASIIAFTLLLKVFTDALGVPTDVWPYVTGTLLIVLGLISVFPNLWESFAGRLRLSARSSAQLSAARQKTGTFGAIATGAALGPVFTSCSPLYGYVVVTVLPAQFGYGLVLLAAYALGLCATLLAIALLGRKVIAKVGWAADARGWFRRGLGVLFVLIGVAIMTGFDKTFETWLIANSPITPWEWDSGFIPE